mgnify:FL=1|jgi:hypothetical protein
MLVLLVLLSFVGMTGYSVLLHNHDLDFEHMHDDCASCQWTQAHKTDKTDSPEITQIPSVHTIKYRTQRLDPQTSYSGFYNRGPPTVS